MRFDVLLFELRLFKSRTQAGGAIQSGEALLNGATVKPSRDAGVGVRFTLVGAGHRRTLEVLVLPHGSISREAAKALVREIHEP
jgi:ribosomal 50S subunit-recycling heat shock protein